MNIRLWMVMAVVPGSFSLGAAILPGEPVPDLMVQDSAGTAVHLSSYRQKKQVALLAADANRAVTIAWPDTNRRLAALDTVVLFLPTNTGVGRSLLDNGSAATLLIDRAGIVRRLLNGRVLTGADLEHFVDLWQSGKSYFLAYCARCHGEDGGDTLCVEKPLTGAGKRFSPEQVRENLHIGELNERDVVIRGEIIKRYQLEAIIIYVGGM